MVDCLLTKRMPDEEAAASGTISDSEKKQMLRQLTQTMLAATTLSAHVMAKVHTNARGHGAVGPRDHQP